MLCNIDFWWYFPVIFEFVFCLWQSCQEYFLLFLKFFFCTKTFQTKSNKSFLLLFLWRKDKCFLSFWNKTTTKIISSLNEWIQVKCKLAALPHTQFHFHVQHITHKSRRVCVCRVDIWKCREIYANFRSLFLWGNTL